jgi:hypothetical protein
MQDFFTDVGSPVDVMQWQVGHGVGKVGVKPSREIAQVNNQSVEMATKSIVWTQGKAAWVVRAD